MNLFGQNSNSKHKLICYRQLKPPFTIPWMCFEFEFWPNKFIIYTLDEFFSLLIVYIDVGDNYQILATVLTTFVTNIHYVLTSASGISTAKMSPTSRFCHQRPKMVTNVKSPTLSCHHHYRHLINSLKQVKDEISKKSSVEV